MVLLHLAQAQSAAQWLHERVSGGRLHTDSRRITPGDAFIAWPGAATDGRRYVRAALQAGAAACLIEHEGAEAFGFDDHRIASFSGLKAASGPIAAAYYDAPSKALDVLAVTGTNGKTSTAWWMAQLLNILRSPQSLSKKEQEDHYSCALIGTLGMGTPGRMVATGLTTPDPVMLQAEFARLREAGATAVAIEASSIGIAEHRLDATAIRTAIFTNFTQDHLDYHGSMDAYWAAKRALFDWPGLQSAVINIDDARGEPLARALSERGLRVWTTSLLRTDAPTGQGLWATPARYEGGLMHCQIVEGSQRVSLSVPVVGDYNLANLLGVVAAARDLGYGLAAIALALMHISAVPGRMEHVQVKGPSADQPLVIVDYAHTPDALTQVLRSLKPVAAARGGRLWCVFGCGGDRDPGKRPLMGRAAELGADRLVITSDNPRSEAPGAIIDSITTGLVKPESAWIEVARAQAIASAIERADAQDVVLLAGKGHEDYQEIAGVKHPFSDIVCAQESLSRRANTKPSLAGSRA